MAYIEEYWLEKEKMAEQARQHTEEMERMYSGKIKESVKGTVIYDVDFQSSKKRSAASQISLKATDSVSAIMRHANECKKRMAVLNFSSYKNPGGMFLNGVKAQEESLCHNSYLYNVLSEFLTGFYYWNRKHASRALYRNRGLYSPDIMFEKDGNCVFCDVITCAAPNKSAARQYKNVSDEENSEALRSRIRFVLDIAKENQVNVLILGAYGCGVFGQNAEEVAGIFREYLFSSHRCFDKVIFAIPEGRDKNFEAFAKAFELKAMENQCLIPSI